MGKTNKTLPGLSASELQAMHDRADPDARSLILAQRPKEDGPEQAAPFIAGVRQAIKLGMRNRNARIDVKCVREAFGLGQGQ